MDSSSVSCFVGQAGLKLLMLSFEAPSAGITVGSHTLGFHSFLLALLPTGHIASLLKCFCLFSFIYRLIEMAFHCVALAGLRLAM